MTAVKMHHRKKHNKKVEDSNSPKRIADYQVEFSYFLQERLDIKDTNDFWKFYTKYTSRQPRVDFDRNKLINLDFTEDLREFIPTVDRSGTRIYLKSSDIDNFLLSIKIYQDFRQKSKFAKLKKLRQAQNDLPIARYKNEIIEKLNTKRVLLIAGDTGCGKSTQVPQYIMEAGYKKVVCTQPRRIACISLSKRVSYETLTEFKSIVGYQIRFEKSKRADTAILFMTEGLLLRQAAEEETLQSYDVIILDEVHERHLHCDLLVAIMKCMLYKRNDFKLILMSATINLELFKNYFKNEQLEVIQVPGRLYPIEIIYKPIVKDPYDRNRDRFNCTPYLQIIQSIDEKYDATESGDMLIFLNGYNEICTLMDAVQDYSRQRGGRWIVLPLHSTLSIEEQDKVFDYPPEGLRKCVISTNIAETSVTIDGIRFVIDSGKVNRMVYHSNGGVKKLSEVTISRDSAKQRAGRAGRTGPGICFRLYSDEDFQNFEPFTPAEIHLVPLDSLLLHMVSLGLSDLSHFPFLETPSTTNLEEGVEKLKFIGAFALEATKLQLTSLGDALSQLPVDLCIGKMLILSTVFGNTNAVLATAALLSVQNPQTQTRDLEVLNQRQRLDSDHGDPLSLLNYYKSWLLIKMNGENSRKWARSHGLEEQRFYEVTKLSEQFRDILHDANLLPKTVEETKMSSGERSIRHGELKQLKEIRKRLNDERKTQKRKQLKRDEMDGNEQLDEKADLRDIEFKIANDFKRLQRLLDENSTESHKDLIILKLILTSGLYPQVAVEDEFNSSKTVSERLYHTKSKNFVFLRPNSYFACTPEILQITVDEIEVPPAGYFSKRPLSRKHQLLVYQTILETKKVYLVNTMRMPMIQTLLLFAKVIATNSTLTKFVFDDFLMIDAPYYGHGKIAVEKTIKLRKKWKELLEKRLRFAELDLGEVRKLAENLVDFANILICYNVKRLLPADLKEIYTRQEAHINNLKNPFDPEFEVIANSELGGINVTEYLVYDCLNQEQWAYDLEEQIESTPYVCGNCNKTKNGCTVLKILHHELSCTQKKSEETEASSIQNAGTSSDKVNCRKFHCAKCDQTLLLTPTDFLKHRKACLS